MHAFVLSIPFTSHCMAICEACNKKQAYPEVHCFVYKEKHDQIRGILNSVRNGKDATMIFTGVTLTCSLQLFH